MTPEQHRAEAARLLQQAAKTSVVANEQAFALRAIGHALLAGQPPARTADPWGESFKMGPEETISPTVTSSSAVDALPEQPPGEGLAGR